jgi:hypothetical protein
MASNTPVGACGFCGGVSQQTARTRFIGEGEDAVAYRHFVLVCGQCGREQEDGRLQHLNEAEASVAKALSLGR